MRVKWSRLADVSIVAAIVLVALAALGALVYHRQRLEQDQLAAHRQMAVQEARHNGHLFGQTLNTVELSLRGLLQAEAQGMAAPAREQRLRELLHNAPHLRSLSLVDAGGTVVASSNPANLGARVDLHAFLPEAEAVEPVLRLGAARAGRDLADGRAPAGDGAAGDPGFVPVALGDGRGRLSALATLNMDFFLNRLMSRDAEPPCVVDLLRYDGAPLLSTRESEPPAWRAANLELVRRWHEGAEIGTLVQPMEGLGPWITAYRGDRTRPFAVVARVEQAQALAGARDEARRQALVVLPLVLLAAGGLLAGYRLFRGATLRRMQDHAEQAEHLGRLLDALPASVLLFGADGGPRGVNQAWRAMARGSALAEPPEGLHLDTLAGLLQPDEDEGAGLREGIEDVLAGRHEAFEGIFRTAVPHGPRWFRILVRPLYCAGERCALVLQLDVTDQRRNAEELRLASRVFAINAEAIVITDAANRIVSVNPAFTRITGYTAEEVLGHTPSLLGSGEHDAAFFQALWHELLTAGTWAGEIVNRRKDGEAYTAWQVITVDRDAEGRPRHYVGVFQDISARKRQERELQRLATTDALTGVLNRRAFLDELGQELARFRRHGRAGALLMLDLDHFKQVNDRHGHAVGDAVLVRLCMVLRERLRRTDHVGRLGGEEFAVLLPETGVEEAWALAQALRQAVAAQRVPTADAAVAVGVTVSIGLAPFRPGETDPAPLLVRADEALYQAKAQGRDRVVRVAEAAAGA
ncbi:diguanylate cyclase [Azohydromonas caseinilytica]|uniref:Diguanylate cyclase n=1 Tax=Azohydromonas caseinilytica TaxID=2728836 RepID=A0A848FAP7_9BURK|nr:diguanylate cyclase [Azohydromonas caseinilytica]NML16604.1 diguanylate cyclase [Azohydromonas caseinilytica]